MKNRHVFSMTCKVDSVMTFSDSSETAKAVEWMKLHGIGKVYLEIFRNGVEVPRATLEAAKKFFEAASFETAACVTTTRLSAKPVSGWSILSCFSDRAAAEKLSGLMTLAASLFSTVILDDFFFNGCSCPDCEKAFGNPERAGARADQMLEIAKENVLAPARKANPDVKVIIKYPCWYESYYSRGYDVARESELFDGTWTGTETRDPGSVKAGRIPQTQASFLMGWMNLVCGEKSGGAWYDPFDTAPSTFVEQAREAILGGARESLLHCYDYLGSEIGNVTSSADMGLADAFDDAEAFRLEFPLLEELAERLSGAVPFGVSLPRKPSVDAGGDSGLPGFAGMLGIPVKPAVELEREAGSAFLTYHASAFDSVAEYIADLRARGVPFVLTKTLAEKISFAETKNATFGVLRVPADLWELMDMGRDTLDTMRNMLLEPFGISMHAPSRVALHLYRKEGATLFVLENFNDCEVKIRLEKKDSVIKPVLGIPEFTCAFGGTEMTLAAHSLILCSC